MKTEYDRLSKLSRPGQRGNKMTIGIAALCEDRHKIVLCSDSLIGSRVAASETAETKVRGMASGSYVLMSGDPTRCQEVLDASNAVILSEGHRDLRAIAEIVHQECGYAKRQGMEEIFQSEGFKSWAEYNANLSKHDRLLMARIEVAKALYRLHVWLILCGFEGSEGTIFRISSSEKEKLHDLEGFAAIGVGEDIVHAVLHSRGCNPALPVSDVVPIVYEAKRLTECSRDIGKKTNILIVDPMEIRMIDGKGIKQLAAGYEEWVKGKAPLDVKAAAVLEERLLPCCVRGRSRRIEIQ